MGSLTSDVCLTLLRQKANWQAAAFDAALFRGTPRDAEGSFNRRVVTERAKFEKEEAAPMIGAAAPTLAVVTLVAGVKGNGRGALERFARGKARVDEASVAELLETLAAEAAAAAYGSGEEADRGMVGVEILWTPSTPDEVLSREEVVLDYPDLIDL